MKKISVKRTLALLIILLASLVTAQEELNIHLVGNDQIVVHTAIVIDAPVDVVWSVLTNFDDMADWSSSLQNIEGDISNGGSVTTSFLFQGNVLPIPHTLLYSEGEFFGWSDPLQSIANAKDHHIYKVEDLGNGTTKFIQSDAFIGETVQAEGQGTALFISGLYRTFNQELKAETESIYSILRPQEELDIRLVGDDQLAIHTSIVIDASAADVWTALTDFDAMSEWSSTFKGIEGKLVDGGQITAKFLFQGNVIPVPHTLILSEGEYYGWSDPMQSVVGASDYHIYKVEDLGNGTSRFIQSDTFTGENVQSKAGLDTALFATGLYKAFNAELKAEVEGRF